VTNVVKPPKGSIASERRHPRTDAMVVSRACDTGSSYNKSPNISNSNSISPEPSPDHELVAECEVLTPTLQRLRRRSRGHFLRGPIPIHMIATAGRLPGRALLVFLAIHYRVTVTGKRSISLPPALLAEFGFDKDVKSRGLRELEQAGLIEVKRAKGRTARVALVSEEAHR
jgi:hypothetical protein